AIVITGHFQRGPVSFGGPNIINLHTDAGGNLFVAKLDANGEHVWSMRAGDTTMIFDLGGRVAIDPTGRVVVAGQIGYHVAILWISADGKLLLEKETPGKIVINESDVGPVRGITVDAEGNAIVTGMVSTKSVPLTGGGVADFGGGPIPDLAYE